MQLLPLFLKHGKTYELPIVIPGCRQIYLHEMIYRHKTVPELITRLRVNINGESIEYLRSKECGNTFYIDGDKDKTRHVMINEFTDLTFSLEIACRDFESCHCKDNKFQLNISADCE